jgi:hypothetical protein
MAVTIDATVGGASANSYCTLAEAESYFEERLHTATWDAANNVTKNAALVWARKILDEQVQWVGTAADSSQALRWPRSGVVDQDDFYISSAVVPDFVKEAQAELAAWLISSDRFAEDSTKGYKEIEIGRGEVRLKIDKNDRTKVLPDIVWSMIMYYAVKKRGAARRLVRV